MVIVGGARGADTMAAEWATARSIPCLIYMADWSGLGPKAGPIRNQRMLDEGKPDLVIAFPEAAAQPIWCDVRGRPASRQSKFRTEAILTWVEPTPERCHLHA